jgi:hypothetical protein
MNELKRPTLEVSLEDKGFIFRDRKRIENR